MATKKCKHCQTEVDAKARVCPQCHGKLGMTALTGLLLGMSSGVGCVAAGLGGIVAIMLLPMMLCNPMETSVPSRTLPQIKAMDEGKTQTQIQEAVNSCEKHIEVHDAKFWAKEMGRSEMWVLTNHHINLLQFQGTPAHPDMGRLMGKMRVGSRALILEETTYSGSHTPPGEKTEDYRVKSPLDGSVGWVNAFEVARTLYQHVDTFESCAPPEVNPQGASRP